MNINDKGSIIQMVVSNDGLIILNVDLKWFKWVRLKIVDLLPKWHFKKGNDDKPLDGGVP